jgi:ABC-type molybdate transport system substrate-binding protein
LAYFQNIKKKIGEYFLLKQHAAYSRKRDIMNIDSAHTIGILYCGDNAADVERMKKYIHTLRDMGKQVKSLGFINVKEVPAGLNGSEMHQYFSLKELNWYGRPSSQFIHNFVKEEFDMLFDFGLPLQLPIMFITSMSKAKCKVGRYMEKYIDLYDVMIEADEKNKLDYVVKTTHDYMMLLNKKKAAS